MITLFYLCKKEQTMATQTARVQTAFRLPYELIARVKYQARKENMSVNRYVESVLAKSVELVFPSRPSESEIPEELFISKGCLQEPSAEELKNDPRLAHILGYDQSAD